MSARQTSKPLASSGSELTRTAIPRLALSVDEACAALGVSWHFWHEHIAAEVRMVRRGRRRLVAVSELQRWLDEHGELILERG